MTAFRIDPTGVRHLADVVAGDGRALYGTRLETYYTGSQVVDAAAAQASETVTGLIHTVGAGMIGHALNALGAVAAYEAAERANGG